MARQFKLRLGDGTVLAVDDQGLRTWAVDEKAMVQPSGSSDWRPLKDVLAASRPARPDDGVAVIPLKPLDGEPSPAPAGSLPSLRLAHAEEEWQDDEVYEGGGLLATAWLWLQRAVLLAALAAGAYIAATTWPTWLPVVTRLGLIFFTKIDEQVHPRRASTPGMDDAQQRERQEALKTAGEQLPHLAPETIQLVLSSSAWSIPDPPEVFSRAYAAAKNGSSALTAPEAEELKSLQGALLAALRPAERGRLRDYDRVRGLRATLPSEDRAALGAFARGTRALSPASRGRLQALLGKAVAAGLGPARS